MTLSRNSFYTAALSTVSVSGHSGNSATLSGRDKTTLFPQQIVTRQAPATCGELMQGTINDQDFLVNCPIEVYAQATIFPADVPGLQVRDSTRYSKVVNAIALLDAYVEHRNIPENRCSFGSDNGSDAGRELVVSSNIPRGKGMASSSADLAAALSVACEIRGLGLSPIELSKLIARVEPSDSVHLPGIAHVNHLNGAVHACLPAPENLSVVVVDCGGEINTLEFDREHARSVYRRAQNKVIATLALLTNSLRLGDSAGIALAATMSARISQEILPKMQFDDLLDSCIDKGAIGVNCAHSGTVLGVLYRTSDKLGETLIESIQQRFGSDLEIIGNHRIVSGGCHAR